MTFLCVYNTPYPTLSREDWLNKLYGDWSSPISNLRNKSRFKLQLQDIDITQENICWEVM